MNFMNRSLGAIIFLMALSQGGLVKAQSPTPSPTSTPLPTALPSPTGIPSQTNSPTPTPFPPVPVPHETVQMNIQFQTETCTQYPGSLQLCSQSIYSQRVFKIPLYRTNVDCPENRSPNEPVIDCSNELWQGHWIDLHQSPSERYIGIITITKTMWSKSSDPNSPPQAWYSLEVEILGRKKTLARMSGGFASWSDLQTVTLMAEELETPYSSERTSLRFGPSFELPGINSKTVLLSQPWSKPNPKIIEWNVQRGTLIK